MAQNNDENEYTFCINILNVYKHMFIFNINIHYIKIFLILLPITI